MALQMWSRRLLASETPRICAIDGVLRPAPMAEVVAENQRGSVNHLVETFDDVPTGLRVGDWVTLISGPEYGAVYRVEER